jgi:tetratricopeptide (TPR) repeat protein
MTLHPTSRRLFTLVAAASLLLTHGISAQDQQIQFPQASQRHYFKQRVGLTDVEVDYSRPNKNSREIFGGLLPYGKVWRTGANATTKIKFSDAVKLGEKAIPAGEYVLFTIPNQNEWTVIVYKDTKVQSAGDYKQENDQARITVKPGSESPAKETFTIELNDVKGASAMLDLVWDKTRVSVPLTTDDIDQVARQLDATVKSNTTLDPRIAYQAAGFYYDNNKDLNQAAKWIDQAVEKNQDAYFMHLRRAQIQQKLGNKKEASASAEKAIAMLKKEPSPDEGTIKSAQQIIDSSK